MFLKLSLTVDDIFRKLERVKRLEKKKKLAKIRYENEIVRKYANIWKKNVFEGIGQQSYSMFVEAQKQAARFQRRKSSMTVDMDNLKEIRRQKEILEIKIDSLLNGKDFLKPVKPARNNALHTIKKVVSAVSCLSEEANDSNKGGKRDNIRSVDKRAHQAPSCSDSSYNRDDDTLKTPWMIRSLSDSGFESKEQEDRGEERGRRVNTALPRPTVRRTRETRRRRELRQLAETKRMSAEPGAR